MVSSAAGVGATAAWSGVVRVRGCWDCAGVVLRRRVRAGMS